MSHKKYKLHHVKHTGKLLHHRHTHYPALLLIVLAVGALMFLTGRIASADDMLVSATVPAPIPAGAPVFTVPADNSVTTNPAVQFRGTCPIITPAVIIALYEGSTLLGSVACEADGTFQITTSLTPGAHTVIATVITITGDIGQSSSPLHITYMPPTNPTPAVPGSLPRPSMPDAGSVAPLDIIGERAFITFSRDLRAEWRGRFTGGIPPYDIIIAWGDGDTSTRTAVSSDLQILTHRYRTNRLYTVSITVKDESGLSLTRYYASMRGDGAPQLTNSTSLTNLLDSPVINPFWAAYLIYLCLLVTMLLMWRYEHSRHPYRVVGFPLHYPWQHYKH